MRVHSLLFAVIACSALALPIQAQLKGDLNEDGRVTATDALMVSRYAAGTLSLSSWQIDRGNFVPLSGGKGGLTAGDAHYIAQIASGVLGPPRPTIDTVTGTNPVTVTGTCPSASTVTIYVSNTAKTVPGATGVTCSGGTYSAQAFLLFDGVNRLHALSHASGLPSIASNVMTASYTNNNTHTITSNTLSGTLVWTAGNSSGVSEVYTINPPTGTTVTIASGSTVVIGPGATLEIAAGKTLQVAGTLIIRGSAGSVVTLRKGTGTGNWQGLVVNASASLTALYTKIQDATIGIDSQGTVYLRQSTITAPSGGGDGVKLYGSSASATLEWNELIGAGYWLGKSGVVLNSASWSRLTGNVIHHFYRGVEAYMGSGHHLEKNYIYACDTGINTQGSALQVYSENRIESNTKGVEVAYVSNGALCGVAPGYCWLQGYVPVIRENRFRNNTKHVQTVPIDGNLSQTTTSTRSQMVVLPADRNDWGTSDPSEISDKIQDELDSTDREDLLVGFTPFRVPDTTTLVHDYAVGILSDQSFAAGTPTTRTALGPLVAREGVNTTIPAGMTFLMPANSVVGVAGNLITTGATTPITFKGIDPDGTGPLPTPGYWAGIQVVYVYTGTEQTDLDRLVVEDSTIAIDVEANRSPLIKNSTLRRFSQIGVRFQGATTSAITNTLIDGTGISAGQKALIGIHMKGSATPTVTGSTITGNIWGLWLEGEGFAGTAAPNPVITGNSIFGNSGTSPTNQQNQTYCWTFGANVCMSGYTNAANVNFTGNYWGTTDPEAIRASIINVGTRRVTDAAGATQAVHGANANFSGYLDSAGGTAVDGFTWSSSGVTRVSQTKILLKPVTSPGDSVSIQFTPAQDLTDVSVRIYRENDDANTGLIDTPCTYSMAAAGVQRSCSWDGRNAANEIVPWEAYRYVISGSPAGGGPTVHHDPPRRANSFAGGTSVFGDTASGCFTANPFVGQGCVSKVTDTFDVTVDLAKNQYFDYAYTVVQHYARPDVYAVRTAMQVKATSSINSPVIATPVKLPMLPSFPGQTPNAVTGKWDGRDDQGNLILGEHAISFWVPEPLRPNSIIVENAASKVLSVSADPYLIYQSYDQTTTLGLQLATSAKVKVHILPPGELDIASAVETITLNNGNTLNAGTHTFTWTGQPTGEDSNTRTAVSDGVYSFAVEAQHPTNPGHSSIFRGVIQVRQ